MTKTYPKGSEWRKWDLHVHTPASVLRNEFGQDWDRYVTELFTRAISAGVSAIGITDYYLPEGYKILRREYLDNPDKMQNLFDAKTLEQIDRIKIFPNIEFRLSKLVIGKENDLSWNRKVNYHVLLSDEIPIEKIESDFISQIQICVNASTGQQAERRPLTKSNLEELGQRLIAEHQPFASNGSALFIGMMCASVDEDEISRLLNQNAYFRDKHLTALPCDEDLSVVNWNSQGHNLRKNLIKQAHFIFSSNPKTTAFFLGGRNKDSFVKEFGSIKACLWGSDAHTWAELFKPDKNRHTWIKGDLTFSGLKQVIYDPCSRVAIQELSPQQKSPYQIIDKVRFLDPEQHKLFSDNWQELNPDLNTIIGGKSSGKSLLLYHIAKAVNKEEVDSKTQLAKASNYTGLPPVDFEVVWSNGDVSRLSESNNSKPITYIPQLYINHLAEEAGRSQLNTLIRDILLQNSSFQQFSEDQEKKITTTSKVINQKIDSFFELRTKYSTLNKDAEAIGTRSAITSEIDRLKNEIQTLREISGFTDLEEQKYKYLSIRKTSIENRDAILSKIKTGTEQIATSITNRFPNQVEQFKELILADIGLPSDSAFTIKALDLLERDLSTAIDKFKQQLSYRTRNISPLKTRISTESSTIDNDLKPLLIKITDQASLDLATKKLQKEENKLKQLDDIGEKQASIKIQGLDCKRELSDLYSELITTYRDYAQETSKSDYQFEDDIAVSAEVVLNEDKFNEFSLLFDRRGNMSTLLGDLLLPNGDINFDIDSHAERVTQTHSNYIKKTNIPTTRKGIEDIDVIKKLYSDCFYVNYVVHYKNDDIATMSPGKRGLVLLNLILHLSNASHPILIDQPEDNLDNRTIYDQLKDFVRQKKRARQIIIVTHNANLVVAADAECVIVANQIGQQVDSSMDNHRFEYFSGSLECSYEAPTKDSPLRSQGIRQHVCEILEGGVTAFKERELKYGFKI
ncbi:TrlF family AAA-like ATPase [Pseudomonas sp. yb_2]|uniref:TrlF family AAA-like ATPase n=1 Tax=Pseudomonas sp. yb_2 TaxID=3367218 RepID=UPI00370AEB62